MEVIAKRGDISFHALDLLRLLFFESRKILDFSKFAGSSRSRFPLCKKRVIKGLKIKRLRASTAIPTVANFSDADFLLPGGQIATGDLSRHDNQKTDHAGSVIQ